MTTILIIQESPDKECRLFIDDRRGLCLDDSPSLAPYWFFDETGQFIRAGNERDFIREASKIARVIDYRKLLPACESALSLLACHAVQAEQEAQPRGRYWGLEFAMELLRAIEAATGKPQTFAAWKADRRAALASLSDPQATC